MSPARSRVPFAAMPTTLAMALAVALLPGAAPATGAAPLRFTGDFRWFDSGRLAQDVVTGDLDGDGVPDLVVAQPLDDAVVVLLADPAGGFRSRAGFAAGSAPGALALSDVDGDGRLDLLVTSRSAGTVVFLRGRGDGGFAPARAAAAGGDGPGDALAHDLDGDDITDLTRTTGPGQGTVTFAHGRGDGTFDPPQVVHAGGGPVRVVGLERVGRRSHLIAVADPGGTVSTYESTRGQGFRLYETLRVAGVPASLAAADVDGDGYTDLVVGLATSAPGDEFDRGGLRLLRGRANGRFEPAAALAADFVPSTLASLDVDRDGWPDLLATDRRGGALHVLRNDRAGGFLAPARKDLRIGAGRMAAGDWNCDGRPDVVTLDARGRGAVLLAGNGDGSFGDATVLATDFGPAALWLGDLDADGLPDLLAPDVYTGRLLVLRGEGSARGFVPPGDGAILDVAFAPGRAVGARLRPGGAVDLVVAHETSAGFLSFGRNRGDGTWAFAPDDTVALGGRPVAFALGDLDGDAAPDAVVALAGTADVRVLRGDGAGRFRVHATLSSGESRPVALALGDLDGDARMDLVVASPAAHAIGLWRGSGTGSFEPRLEIRTGLRPVALALADLDGDGALDLVTGQADVAPAAGRVVAYLGDGHGAFEAFDPARTARAGEEPTELVVADFDGVPPLDVAVGDAGSQAVTILPGLSTGRFSFGPPLVVGTAAASQSIVAGDVDRDGRIDLVTAGRTADRIGLLRNRSGDPVEPLPGVTVDLVPGACPNPLDVAAGGSLRVALVSGGAFDLADLLPSSVRLAGVPAGDAAPVAGDESGPADACGAPCRCDGRTPDGVPDAIFTFDTAAVVAALGAVRDGESRRVDFTARLTGGRRIEVHDCVVIAGAAAAGAGAGVPEGDPAAGAGDRAGAGAPAPNPLPRGGTVAWSYAVPAGGADVRIGVFSVAGRRVATLVDGFVPAGAHAVTWTGHDDAGRAVPPGAYFLRGAVGARRMAASLILRP